MGRYLAFFHLLAFLVSGAFLTLFLLTFQMFKAVRLALDKDISLLTVLELLGHMALTLIPYAVPLAMLFATLYVLDKLSSDSAEFIAMRSIGLSRFKLLTPFLLMATLVGVATFTLNDRIIPYSKREFRQALKIMTSKRIISRIKGGNFFTKIPDTVLFAEKVRDSGKKMDHIFIHFRQRDGGERTIFAQEGELVKESHHKWGGGQMQLILKNGSILMTRPHSSEMDKILFQNYSFPLGPSEWSTSFRNKSSMKSSLQLYNEIQSWRNGNGGQNKNTALMRKTEIEFYSRFNTPLLCIIFALLGFALGIQGMRTRSQGAATKGLIIFAIYYTLFFGGVSLARTGVIAAPIAVFFPTLLGLGVGLYYFKKLEWKS